MEFREKIDNFMKTKKIDNLKQLAIQSDIPYTTLRDCYEKNDADNSRVRTISKLAKFMNVTTDYLAYSEIESENLTLPEFVDNSKEITTVLTDEETGYKVQLVSNEPYENLSGEEQKRIIETAMDRLYEMKRELKNKD